MNAESYHLVLQLFKQLNEKIRHESYTGDRGGLIPPERMPYMRQLLIDALASYDEAVRFQTTQPASLRLEVTRV